MSFLAAVGAAAFGAAAASASAEASSSETAAIEGIWSFKGGHVGIKREPNGTLTGIVVTPTKFASCTHEVGEEMWTGMALQPDGSFWGLHQWFFEKPDCPPNPALGLTGWRVLENHGYRQLHVCFSDPGSDQQPTITADGDGHDYSYGCFDSELVAPLPNPDFAAVASDLPAGKGCLLRKRLRIRLRDPENDPLKKVLITLRSGGVSKTAKVKPNRNGFVGVLNLRNLPEAPFTVTIRVTTVLGNHLSGKRRYGRCQTRQAQTHRDAA